jgi:hypothetical protein
LLTNARAFSARLEGASEKCRGRAEFIRVSLEHIFILGLV